MAKKIRDWLFPENKKPEYTTTSIEISAKELENEKQNNQVNRESTPPKIIKINEFKNVEDPANDLVNGTSIIVDLSECDQDTARRIVDFFNGVIFAINGQVQKVAHFVYLFTPNTK